ncbi:MAG TPA: cobalamin-dependent protein [Woeseiaceae bacterium]|jgi:methylmalonyl-CoA mutase C-terminal domain/subunit|nr:cobalamin-dependent protein [Woeseiaceae bacterium]
MTDRKKRILIAKPGLDGHDQGAKIVVRALMDAGFEVVYTGLRQTPAQVVGAARDYDVDVIGLSSMAGSHLAFCRRLKELIAEEALTDKLWIIGGNIPAEDFAELESLGLDGIFPVGTNLDAITDFIKERLP